MNVIVDTCVIIDALQAREPFAEDSQAVCLAVAEGKVVGLIPAKSTADIYYIMHRSLHSNEVTRELLKKLFMSFGILDTTALDCQNALDSSMSDYEDAVLAETAKRSGVDYIITRNCKDYKQSSVPVKTPGELLTLLKPE
ncbi:MAG: PIN domain-containing protein [Firmicutes bacterium]|nr:PIN domain-containing protein [Bacillota bacterium]